MFIRASLHVDADTSVAHGNYTKDHSSKAFSAVSLDDASIMLSTSADAQRLIDALEQAKQFLESQGV